MNYNQFTIKSQEAIQKAQEIARERQHQMIDTHHLLKGIMMVDENVTPFLLKKLNINLDMLNQVIEREMEATPKTSGGEQYLSRDANETLQRATEYLKAFGDEFVAIEHLLLALQDGKDKTARMLKDFGITTKELKAAIKELRKGASVHSQSAEETYNALNKYSRNLNTLAREGKLDPVIGRDEEIRRILQILSRRTKNNPILIGEPGTGKTAIAEGLAHRIINGDIPDDLKSKQIFSLDMGALIAGAKYKGEFEERLKSVVNEVIASNGEVVLFIDEIHTLIGAGKGEGAMDAANILKPALARGDLRAIGATTLKEYQQFFENDKALERRFQIVMVDEPDSTSAISILRGLRERYETYHKVRIKDEAIIAAVELSQRYITDRFLPDKAIDLVDEAAARLRLAINSKPEALDKAERQIQQLEIEREAILREKDKLRLNSLNEKLANQRETRNQLHARWQNEKEVVDKIQLCKKNIETYKQEAIQAERSGDYGKVAELRYGKIKAEQVLLDESKDRLKVLQGDNPMINEEVTADSIAEIVSKWTGIPVTRMVQSERVKLLNMEDELHHRVIGQQPAIESISDAIRRSRAGLQDSTRPIGSFIFLGTTGVGKTELAKALAEYLFNDEDALVRIDMSEYQERHAVSRLIGAPPGYVGYDEGGQLTEKVRRKPYSVVLLDEIEKAHPDVFNILLQVLDDGRLTDNKGRVADFKNTIIIMTSNLGSQLIREQMENSEHNPTQFNEGATYDAVMDLLKKTIRPEFLNRIDETIMFKPLSQQEIRDITTLQIKAVEQRLIHNGITLKISDEAMDKLASLGYNPQFGARPLKRVIQKELLNALSKFILQDELKENQTVLVEIKDNKFNFRKINELVATEY